MGLGIAGWSCLIFNASRCLPRPVQAAVLEEGGVQKAPKKTKPKFGGGGWRGRGNLCQQNVRWPPQIQIELKREVRPPVNGGWGHWEGDEEVGNRKSLLWYPLTAS